MALSKITNQQIDSSGLPSGSIIQTVQSTSTTEFSPDSGGGSWQDAGYNITITPTSTSNKVLISFTSLGIIRGPNTTGVMLHRGSTEIWSGDGYSNNTAEWQMANYGFSYLDSPATTSATTYTVYMWGDTITSIEQMRMTYQSGTTTGNAAQAVLIAQEIVG